jgi:threonine synthase
VYYFYAWSRLARGTDDRAVFSVPSGNFGNLMGGLIAHRMGLPVKQFIVSTNENDEVPEFLRTGAYQAISPSKNCISSAMNVGHPSNLARIVSHYGGAMDENGEIFKQPDLVKMREDIFAVSISESATRKAIADAYEKYGLLLEPHGAIAWQGIQEYYRFAAADMSEQQLCISLETAHPAKFPDEIRRIINVDPPLPESLAGLEAKTEDYSTLDNNYELLKKFILKNL